MKKIETNHTSHLDLELSFDVGHSSIGWAVVNNKNHNTATDVFSSFELLGCGVVTFEPDSCLAKKRREYRRQRRHIRSTRQRIKRIKQLLAHLKVLTPQDLDKPGCAWPWKLAARVLQNGKPLSWKELWDVLRWYAHNRGYDENRLWAESANQQEEKEDTERLQKAIMLMEEFGTNSMAETICKILDVNPHNDKKNSSIKRFKELDVAFPRDVVVRELKTILQKHIGKLNGVDDKLIEAITGTEKYSWKTIECPTIKLPARYRGGLLFGQLIPRFENRIISTCPFTKEKLPSKNCAEYYKYRWAMLLANIMVQYEGLNKPRPLNSEERKEVNSEIQKAGISTKNQLREIVNNAVKNYLSKNSKSSDNFVIITNLSKMFLTEEMEKALEFDPVQKLIKSKEVQKFWHILPEQLQKRLRGKWRRGKQLTLADIRDQLRKCNENLLTNFDKVVNYNATDSSQQKIPGKPIKILKGRAPYSRKIMQRVYEEVLSGKDPRKEGGCIFRSEEIRKNEIKTQIAKRTNNHLVRHRLLILERLLNDIIKEYANNNYNLVSKITIEVNRDLREFSGMTAKEIQSELNSKTKDHKEVVKKLEEELKEVKINGNPVNINGTLIRKARIAADLEWTCPYTGIKFEAKDLAFNRVDLDHIIPRSMRPSDSLDSMVITFPEVNKWKGQRLAYKFIQEEQGKEVPGLKGKHIHTLKQYEEWVKKLNIKGHPQDSQRKKRRKEFLLMQEYTEEEFLPRDLTQTSQLVRLAAQTINRIFLLTSKNPVIISMPGSITAFVRRHWNLMGCLAQAVPLVLDENKKLKTKEEIRSITHLHHAVDACTLALASHFIPHNGRIWELMLRKKLNESEQNELKKYLVFQFDSNKQVNLKELPATIKNQISNKLCERRLVQHIPKDMSGAKLEETVWRILEKDDTSPSAKKFIKWCEQKKITIPDKNADEALIVARVRRAKGAEKPTNILHETEKFWWKYDICKKSKLIGLEPKGGIGKLKKLKAVKIIGDNYGVALDPEPKIIRAFKVYPQIRELVHKNQGKPARILRNGQIIIVKSGTYKGIWRILSVKDNKAGISLDLIKPHILLSKETKLFRKEYIKINSSLESVINGGLVIKKTPYTGFNYLKECHST